MTEHDAISKAIRNLKNLADDNNSKGLTEEEREAIGWALSYAVEHCTAITKEHVAIYIGLDDKKEG